MSVWRLATTRRWLGVLGLTSLFAIACWGLSQWQFARRHEAQAAIAVLNANYDQPAADLRELVTDPRSFDPFEKWRTVRATGEYVAADVVYARTRSGASGIGFEQLAPLRLDDDTVFIVNRGWIPANADNSAPAETPSVPSGPVTVTARLMPGELLIAGREAPTGQIATIHLPTLDSWIDGDVYTGWYGRLASENPSTPGGAEWTKPVLDEGPHLSYALQWYVFAIMGFIGYGWALRKEARGDVPASTPRAKRAPTDEDLEDAALDAMRVR